MRSVVIGLLAALACIQPLMAEEWSSVLRDAQAKCERQHASIRDITIMQTVSTMTPNGEMTASQLLQEQGKLTRMEMSMPGSAEMPVESLKVILITNEQGSWEFSPFTGKRKLSADESPEQTTATDCWNFTPANSSIIGSDWAQGRECYLVKMSKDSVDHRLWLDKQSLDVIQGVSYSGDDSVRWVLSDFRTVLGDYQHPYKVEMFDGDELISTMTVSSLEVNQGLSADLFNPDKVEMKQVDMQKLLEEMFQAMPDSLDPDSVQR